MQSHIGRNFLGLYLEVITLTNKEIFLEYASKFNSSEKEIKRKINHSIRVSSLCRKIAKSINLSKEEQDIAEFIGLVHDIGRFIQWEEYQTFDDLKSDDHAILGLYVLFDNNVIDKFNVNHEWFKTIFLAIKNHNLLNISNDTKGIDLIMSKILRDADKMDILWMVKSGEIVLDEDNSDISLQIRECFLSKHSIGHTLKMTVSDKILLKMAFVFDVNYEWSIQYIKDERLIEEIYNKLKYKGKIEGFYNFVIKYLCEVNNGKI